MRRNEKAVFVLCVAGAVVIAFLVLRSYGKKSTSETEPAPSAPPHGPGGPVGGPPAGPLAGSSKPDAPLPPRSGEERPKDSSGPSPLVGLPPAGLQSRVYPVDEKYDTVHDVTTCTVTSLKTDDARFTVLSVRWMQAGPSSDVVPPNVHFTLSTKGAARKLDESDEVSLVADGKSIAPSSTKVQSNGSPGAVLEYLSFTLGTQDFLDFANATKEARVKVGAFDLGLGPEERLAMLSLASRFPRPIAPPSK